MSGERGYFSYVKKKELLSDLKKEIKTIKNILEKVFLV